MLTKLSTILLTYLWFPLQSHSSTSQLAVLPGDISIPLHSNSSILSGRKSGFKSLRFPCKHANIHTQAAKMQIKGYWIGTFVIYLTPCVGWYSPPEVSVASERKFEITVLPLCDKKNSLRLISLENPASCGH